MENLNSEQKQAVQSLNGPVLVLAGAGTGKTRVLTTRLCNILLQKQASPYEILTVTFTNKAANEMKQRVENMLNVSSAGWWMGTFHSVAARILRKYPEIVGIKKEFSIIDIDDQIRLLKQVLSYHNVDDKRWPAKNLSYVIQRWKDKGLNPEEIDSNGKNFGNNKGLDLYKSYQSRLRTLNAVDYGDLLLHNLNIFKKEPDILDLLQNKFRYLLVDEYQDTNLCQYQWLNYLSMKKKNICVVGDDDQSIYSWRGADSSNLLKFKSEYKETKVIKLEENYRSTGNILKAANSLICKNKNRLGKNLWTEQSAGEKLEIINVFNSEEEALEVSNIIERRKSLGEKLNNFAILVRASFQTRFFEDRFIKIGLPYKIIGATRFYERLEIKDAIAYLRLVITDFDDLAFERIVNVPRRGIGSKTLRSIEVYARKNNLCLIEAASKLIASNELGNKALNNLKVFINQILEWRKKIKILPASQLTELILDESGYTNFWQEDKSIEADGRLENLKELVNAIEEFDSIKGFLEHIQLVMDNDNSNKNNESVNLLTLHAAKGLEFDNVFLPGWEEEIFPNKRSLEEDLADGLEEERRLAYVGITRAKKRIWITYANNRVIHGQYFYSLPSRFLKELPKENIISYGLNQKDKHISNYSALDNQFVNSDISNDLEFSKLNFGEVKNKNLRIGSKVFHQKFGYGIIISLEGENAEVEFTKTNTKKVKSNFLSQDV